jgi:hypothetical protein
MCISQKIAPRSKNFHLIGEPPDVPGDGPPYDCPTS